MEWQYHDIGNSGKLNHGGSRNLVVATAGQVGGLDWAAVTGLDAKGNREEKQKSIWDYGEPTPEYDLKITITSENQKPHVAFFTVKVPDYAALEMVVRV
jgi:hypothetical protein